MLLRRIGRHISILNQRELYNVNRKFALSYQFRSFGIKTISYQQESPNDKSEKEQKNNNQKDFLSNVFGKIGDAFKHAMTPEFQKKTKDEMGKIADEFVESSKRSATRYGGFKNAEERRLERQRREKILHELQAKKKAQEEEYASNPNAGTQMVLHKESAWKERWNAFKEDNPLMQGLFGLKRSYEESDNIVVHYLHRIQDSITSLFEENEHARALKEIKTIDPDFNEEEFLKEMQDYVIPEVIESFLHGNRKALKDWCSEGAYNVLSATIEEREKAGQHIDSKILELRNVELAMGKIFDERAVLIVTFNTQQVTVIRDNQGKIIEGKEDEIEKVYYVIAVVKEPESNPITSGWKVIEVGIQASTKTW